jgi:transposase-like protein
MDKKRKRYNSDFKAKVALEAIKELKTINELSGQYGLHGNQITNWKKQLKENANQIFEKDGTNKNQQQDELIDRLYKQIGQLQVELDWLKKKFES